MNIASPVHTPLPLQGRSLHRWLVAIPVALVIASLVCFGIYQDQHDLDWLRAALFVDAAAALFTVLVAATGVPELRAIPHDHPTRSIALTHATLNLGVLGCLVASLWPLRGAVGASLGLGGRWDPYRDLDTTSSLVLVSVATGILVISGALGMLMTYRYHLGGAPQRLVSSPPAGTPREVLR